MILQDGGFYLSYYDSRITRHPGSGEVWHGGSEGHTTEITKKTEMYGFEQVIALSHASLDNIYDEYFAKRDWMQRSNNDGFEIHFGAPRVRLLSDKRALVFIPLTSGTLKTGDKESVRSYTLQNKLAHSRLQSRQTSIRKLDARLSGQARLTGCTYYQGLEGV